MTKKQTVSDSTKQYLSDRIDLYGEEVLNYYSLALMHYSATEHYLFNSLCRLIQFPGRTDYALYAALNGASIRVLLKQLSSLALHRLSGPGSSAISKACKNLDRTFTFRNSLAHSVINPKTKGQNIELLTLKQRSDGMPESPKVITVIQLQEVVEKLQVNVKVIEQTLLKEGVEPNKRS